MDAMKNLFYWLLTGCFLLNIAACSDNENIPEEEPIPWGGDEGPKPGHIWSVPSIEFMFQVLDKDGRDLLNPNTPGSYAGAKITATFRDTVYTKDYPVHLEEGRDHDLHDGQFFPTIMYGLGSGRGSYSEEYYITFDGLPQRNNYENEKIFFAWPDGSKDSITFSNRLTWKDYAPVFTGSYFFNEEKLEGKMPHPIITVRKQALHTDDQGEEWELLPLKFYIMLINEDGKDLLNPDTKDDVVSNHVTATLRGEEYVLDAPTDSCSTFKGLQRQKQLFSDRFYLTFGELNGREVYENEDLTLDWGNGQKDVITFTSKMTIENGRPTFFREYFLNGEKIPKQGVIQKHETSFPIIYIIKPLKL